MDVQSESTVAQKNTRNFKLLAIYAKTFKNLTSGLTNEQFDKKVLDELILPSDKHWRQKIYNVLVEMQRKVALSEDTVAEFR